MFWDKAARFYDFFETVYNRKVYREFPAKVAEMTNAQDTVLECACGTGIITACVAQRCKSIIATDYSEGMLGQAKSKCSGLNNVTIQKANIMQLDFADNSFDKVIAGNVIHLLDNPSGAMKELERVCKPGGKIILPTYVNHEKTGKPSFIVRMLKKIGVDFKMQFTMTSYKEFISNMGYTNAEYYKVDGKMPNVIAVITI
ncbi:MAG: class I SAM-dependent methyltransferase [Paludibacteraceae bacterium]|nr:class I SAM-dependent methyltransferase [Paludibacteraceae bacterium]